MPTGIDVKTKHAALYGIGWIHSQEGVLRNRRSIMMRKAAAGTTGKDNQRAVLRVESNATLYTPPNGVCGEQLV